MKILSIDVGMKNLAYCLFECCNHELMNMNVNMNATNTTHPESIMQLVNIMAWDTVNLCATAEPVASKAPTCTHPECKFTAKFAHSTASYYCTRHANASGYKMPLQPSIASSKSLKKMTLEQLKAFSGEYLSSPIPEKCEKSKMKLVQHLTTAIASEYLVAVTA